ncbi:MAG TPA: hypothetical protein VMC10_13160, partial [Stellaceae bacterium]|nr:hypothetical protein [Stellaceae bacterium]
PGVFKEIALSQLEAEVAHAVYRSIEFENVGPPPRRELFGKSFSESAGLLFARILKLQGQISTLDEAKWQADFKARCETLHAQLKPKWEVDWLTYCDGKRFFLDLHRRYRLKVKPKRFKLRVMERMERDNAEAWILIESILRDALKT